MCKLIIPKKIEDKCLYFLNEHSSLEWSGPAWYFVKKDKDGFPEEWTLAHFHPLNLGTSAHTEYEPKDVAPILKPTYKKHKKLEKAYMGLIHSHNTMGAFFSGTDEGTLEECAPDENFFGSLVVAKSGKHLKAFAFSWKDQYKVIHHHEIDESDIVVQSPIKIDKEWKTISENLEKNKTPSYTPIVRKNNTYYTPSLGTYGGYNTNENQTTLFKLNDTQNSQARIIVDSHSIGTITDEEAEKELCKIGVSAYQAGKLLYWDRQTNIDTKGNPYGWYDDYTG